MSCKNTKIFHQVGSSKIGVTEKEAVFSIPCDIFSKKQWNTLVSLMMRLVLGRLVWIMAPNTASNTDDIRARRKVITIDSLTYFLFALLIRSSHPQRKVFFAIDWRRIDERCAAVYKNGKPGAPAYPPQVLFRIIALMFLSGAPFESATLLRLETDTAWRWHAGLSLWTRVPNAGTLSRFRERPGTELFDAILTDLIKACDEAGLIGHEESYCDMTGVEAGATQAVPYQRAVISARAISAWLDEGQGGAGVISRERIARIALEVQGETHPSLKSAAPERIVSSQDSLEEKLAEGGGIIPGWLLPILDKLSMLKQCAAGTPEAIVEQARQTARDLVSVLPRAFGNPDARAGHTRTDGTICGYRSGFLVDA